MGFPRPAAPRSGGHGGHEAERALRMPGHGRPSLGSAHHVTASRSGDAPGLRPARDLTLFCKAPCITRRVLSQYAKRLFPVQRGGKTGTQSLGAVLGSPHRTAAQESRVSTMLQDVSWNDPRPRQTAMPHRTVSGGTPTAHPTVACADATLDCCWSSDPTPVRYKPRTPSKDETDCFPPSEPPRHCPLFPDSRGVQSRRPSLSPACGSLL